MGIFTLFLTNSAHVAPIPGGVRMQIVIIRIARLTFALCSFLANM